MRQERINRLVARATGEDMREIRRMGFTIADPAHVGFDPEPRQKKISHHRLGHRGTRARRGRLPQPTTQAASVNDRSLHQTHPIGVQTWP